MQVEMRAGLVGLLMLWAAELAAESGDDVLPQGFLEYLGNMIEVRDAREPVSESAASSGMPQEATADEIAQRVGELVDPLSLDPEQEVEDE